MNLFNAALLGIIQGLTEFLPVSSSGHLVLFQNLFGYRNPELLLDTSLHFGTLVAVFIYFRSDFIRMAMEVRQWRRRGLESSLLFWVIVASIPTGMIGILFRSPFENLFGSVNTVGLMLVVTGAIVGSTRFLSEGHTTRGHIDLLVALAVGTAQGIAIIPGISRSGITIACALLLGVDRDLAGRFSFLLSIPAIIAALILQLGAEQVSRVGYLPLLLGFCTAAMVGMASLKILMRIVKKGRLYYFAPYCWAIGLFMLLLF